jgi:ribosome biogenesis GTPase
MYAILGANLDIIVLVFAARSPEPNTRLLDRMLVASERGGIEPVICVNKMDLAERPAETERLFETYGGLGYRLLFASAKNRTGIEDITALMSGKISLFAGPSGAGKTSLIAAIQPGLELRVAAVSDRTGKGRHTTTHFELHPLAGGGYLADTPGIREFGVWGVTPPELGAYFREFAPFLGECRFSTCTHSHEPSCAVKEAVASGAIASHRYESYLRILDTIPKARFGA